MYQTQMRHSRNSGSSFYSGLSAMLVVWLLTSLSLPSGAMNNTEQLSSPGVNVANANELDNWIIVNDTVMGGRSQASAIFAQDHMQFKGSLSLQNNGGFASVRRIKSAVDWQAGKAITIVIRGDGRSYQFRLRTNRTLDGVAYVKEFTSQKGEWQSITFTEDDFTPQFRGRIVPSAKKLSFSDITQLGFMLADKAPGDFELHIKSIVQNDEATAR